VPKREEKMPPRPIKVLIVVPSLDIKGGQSRQAVRLMGGLKTEPAMEVGFVPHNSRLPGALRLLTEDRIGAKHGHDFELLGAASDACARI